MIYKMGTELIDIYNGAHLVVTCDHGEGTIEVVYKHHWDRYKELYCPTHAFKVVWDAVRKLTPLDKLL